MDITQIGNSCPVKVATYARVSSEKQEKEDTIASQVERLKKHAAENGYAIVASYQDNGYSGELLARPDLDRLRDDAQKGLFKRVLIHSPDRLARKMLNQELVLEDLQRHGVEVEFLSQKRAESAEDLLLLRVQGVFAEYEKEKIKERMRRGKLHKAKNGTIMTCRAPYGYLYVPKIRGGPRYEINENEAKNVRLIFELIANHGFTLRQLVRELDRRAITPPCRFMKAVYWSVSTLQRIAHNETYAGTTYYNKRVASEPQRRHRTSSKYRRSKRSSQLWRPKDQWVPIPVPSMIDRAIFERVQKIITDNAKFSTGPYKHEYLLRGLLRCGQCGTKYYGYPYKQRRFYYRCAQHSRVYPEPKTCTASGFPAPLLEDAVWKALTKALKNPALLINRIPQLKKSLAQNNVQDSQDWERKSAQLKDEERRLLEAYQIGVISLEQLQSQMAIHKERQRSLDTLKSTMDTRNQSPSTSTLQSVEDFCAAISQGLEIIGSDFHKKRQLLRLLVDQVVLEQEKVRIQGAIPVPSPSVEGSVKRDLFTQSLLVKWARFL